MTPQEITAELEKIRALRKPSRRGILLCGEMMGKMLIMGWNKDQLDILEILFWTCRDGDGRVIKT